MQAEAEQEPAPAAEEEALVADEAPVEPEAEPEAEPAAEPEAEPEPEAIVEPEPEPETAPEPEAQASSEPEPAEEPEPEPEPEATETEPIAEAEPEPEATEEAEAVAEEAAPPAPERVSPVIEVQLRMPPAHGSGWASATLLHSSEITHTLLHTVMLALFSSLVKFFSLQSLSSCGGSGSSAQGPLLTPLREPG